jgi:hypothetical protein
MWFGKITEKSMNSSFVLRFFCNDFIIEKQPADSIGFNPILLLIWLVFKSKKLLKTSNEVKFYYLNDFKRLICCQAFRYVHSSFSSYSIISLMINFSKINFETRLLNKILKF